MSLFAIRDDDLSFWTSVEDIESVYGDFFRSGGKVSFAAIPFSAKMYNLGSEDNFYNDSSNTRGIGENIPLVDYLKEKIHLGVVEIMLHGYDHAYALQNSKGKVLKLSGESRKKKGYIYLSECQIKSKNRLLNEVERGRKYLEQVFGCDVNVYVPPSNNIGPLVGSINMNICSASPKLSERGYKRGLRLWLKLKIFRLFKGYTFPGISFNGKSYEVIGHALTKNSTISDIDLSYNRCSRSGYPFILATHYWEVQNNEYCKKQMREFLKRMDVKGARNVLVSECFEGLSFESNN